MHVGGAMYRFVALTGAVLVAGVSWAQPSQVVATLETEPVPSSGDAADDPAIWIHPTDPLLSTILGTDKLLGLAVYDLSGQQIQFIPDGNLNNVDLRYDFGQSFRLVGEYSFLTNQYRPPVSAMDDIYGVMVTVDYPDAMTSGLRRTTDATRGILERTRGDLTVSVRQRELERKLSDFQGRPD